MFLYFAIVGPVVDLYGPCSTHVGGPEMILSRRAPSCLKHELIPSHMNPFQTKFDDDWTHQNPEIPLSELQIFHAPRKMVQKGMDEIFWGWTFKNTSNFNLRTSKFWVLGAGSLTVDLGPRIVRKLYIWPQTNRTCLTRKDGYIFAEKRWVHFCCKNIGTKILVPRSFGEPV